MKQFTSHREIIECWKRVPVSGRTSFYSVLAADVTGILKPLTVTYYTVRRWHERDSIPVEYHGAVVEAALRRGIKGVSNQVLSSIKTKEMLRLVNNLSATA